MQDLAAFEQQMHERGDVLLQELQAETLRHYAANGADEAAVLNSAAMQQRRRDTLQALSQIYAEIVARMMGALGDMPGGSSHSKHKR